MNESESANAGLVQQMEHWGYYLLPRSHRHSPGHTGLLVAIRETPTRAHFDPESLHLQILREHGVPEWTTFHLEWRFPESCQVCAGRVYLRDRTKKTVEFFTFGGSLESVAAPGETVYSLRSPAPIIELVDGMESPEDAFVYETEVRISKLHAKWGVDDVGFGQRLGQLEPNKLYAGSIASLLNELKTTNLHEENNDLYAMLLRERNWLHQTNRWSNNPPTLEQLLST